jgi:hypothetical protein
METFIGEDWDYTAVWAEILVRTIASDWPDAHYFVSEHASCVKALELTSPLTDGIIIHLFDWQQFHDIFSHQFIVVAVYLGTAKKYHLEMKALLQPKNVLSPDNISAPQVLIVVLTVPPAILSG